MEPYYFLGVDAGGTRTQAALADASGMILARTEAGSGSLRAGAQAVYEALQDVTQRALKTAKIQEINPKKHVLCAAGFAGFSLSAQLEALNAMPALFRAWQFTSDADIACLGAHAGRDGAIVIAGTGSIGFARLGGETHRIGGYGFPISDEGSGAEIGFRALRAYLQMRDGRRKPDALATQLAPLINEKGVHWWRDAAAPKDYADLAPSVFAAHVAGSGVATAIFERAGEDISNIALALCARGAPAWSFMGGLAAPLKPFLMDAATKKHTAPLGTAIDGALWLARRLA